ncbi:MAG: serine/threonine protein kinase [Polyangiaceae bacterium]|nr:serine/threonine protein kinase [Polyangiaceae bacterium]
MNLEPGQVLSGTLRLVRKIANGGMGSVWLTEHLLLGKQVAVKFMSPEWALTPGARERFLREARITGAINSPHVVRVLDCRLTEGGEPYLVLELLRGETLEQRVQRLGPLSLGDVANLVSQTCNALSQAHKAGFVHRDIKPENVFLETGQAGQPLSVKLLDFGVAKPVRSDECIEGDRLAAGTARYMSPEHMFDPEKTDERSDLFSLAAVAYFALTQRSPYNAHSLEGFYFAIDAGRFDRPTELRPELPRAIDAWFNRALAHDPAARFANAGAMARALHDIVRTSHAQRDPYRRLVPGVAGLAREASDSHSSRVRRTAAAATVLASVVILFAWHDGHAVKDASAKADEGSECALRTPAELPMVECADAIMPFALPQDIPPSAVTEIPDMRGANGQ